MNIFITGATGFIGTHLIHRLHKTNHKLFCLVRGTSACGELEKAGATVIRGDVTDERSVRSAMKGCEWVVNLANYYEFWAPERGLMEAVNVGGTMNVMRAALAEGASKVLHVSTVAVYGNAPWPVDEKSAMGPECSGEYARTKREGDLQAWQFQKETNLPLVMIYPGAVLGPDDPKATGRYIRNVLQRRMPAQVFTRSPFPFVHVRDVAETIVRALEKEGNIGEKYLVVSESLTFGEINAMLSTLSGAKLPWLVMPGPMALFGAYFLTGIANLTGKPPLLDMSVDQMRLMKQGLRVDGSKAARELGLAYTPIRAALEEQAAALKSLA